MKVENDTKGMCPQAEWLHPQLSILNSGGSNLAATATVRKLAKRPEQIHIYESYELDHTLKHELFSRNRAQVYVRVNSQFL